MATLFFGDKDKKLFTLPCFHPQHLSQVEHLLTTIHEPQGENRCQFAKEQNTCKKHVEQGFGILQFLFMIIHNPSMFWDIDIMVGIVYMYVILHNMVIEDEIDLNYIHVLITKPFT